MYGDTHKMLKLKRTTTVSFLSNSIFTFHNSTAGIMVR